MIEIWTQRRWYRFSGQDKFDKLIDRILKDKGAKKFSIFKCLFMEQNHALESMGSHTLTLHYI